MRLLFVLVLTAALIGCEKAPTPDTRGATPPVGPTNTQPPAETPKQDHPSGEHPGAGVATPALQPIAIPADGKIENVKVNGITVPMINIMDGGTVILVDTDGVKPRSWEEQYKRKGALPKGYFDLHKSNTNKNDTFEDDEIDKQGRWKMDEKGNLVQD